MRSSARAIFEVIAGHAKSTAFDVRNRRTWLGYKDIHDRLGLEQAGDTYGNSLNTYGLGEIAVYCKEHKLPAITGIVIDGGTRLPGDGFFSLLDVPLAESEQWLDREAQRIADEDWKAALAKLPKGPSPAPVPAPTTKEAPGKPVQRSLLDEVESYEHEQSYGEGRLQPNTSLSRARSAALAERARAYWKSRTGGQLVCQGCDWKVPKSVSDVSESHIIELHHTKPLSAYPDEGETVTEAEAIRRLRPLCPTCHRIAHAKDGREVFSIAEVRGLVGKEPKEYV